MIEQAIGKIVDLAKRASQPKSFRPEGERRAGYYMEREAGGQLEWIDGPPPPRHHVMSDVSSFVRLVEEVAGSEERCVVFVSEHGPKAVLNDRGQRDDCISLALHYTAVWLFLEELDKHRGQEADQEDDDDETGGMTQAQAIRALRTRAAGFIASDFIAALRSMKLAAVSEAERVQQHGSTKVSTSTQRNLAQGEKPIPDEVVFRVPVYEEVEDLVDVRCIVDIDLVNGRVRLIPIAGALSAGRLSVLQNLSEDLNRQFGDDESTLVVLGSP